jgi:dihydroorotase
MKQLIKNAAIVNEGKTIYGDVLISGKRIEKIAPEIDVQAEVTDAKGMLLLPGLVDDQVHFREPGLEYKGDIYSESRAAVAGGITSYIEQPNTKPPAVTMELLEQKFELASQSSYANYSFNLGATNDNIEELLRADYSRFAGIKVFMGSSTGNMLVDSEHVLNRIFRDCGHLIITHCEDEETIRKNLEHYKTIYGEGIPASCHPLIRSEEACYLSSQLAMGLARKYDSRLHVFHVSTAKEGLAFDAEPVLSKKKITAEACIHHLWFSDADYEQKGNMIKWNPAVKTAADREGIWQALREGRIDVIATDHAPHSLEEKKQPYLTAPSGGPLVQHSLPAMMEFVKQGRISLEMMVEKFCHNPVIIFRIKDRGYIREGYFADLVLVDPNRPQTVDRTNILYKCGWSPFEGETFQSTVVKTWVNGHLAYSDGLLHEKRAGERLIFDLV